MSIEHLHADPPSEDVPELLKRDGGVVIDRALKRAVVDRIHGEMVPDRARSTREMR
jgi:hypothetical protein